MEIQAGGDKWRQVSKNYLRHLLCDHERNLVRKVLWNPKTNIEVPKAGKMVNEDSSTKLKTIS